MRRSNRNFNIPPPPPPGQTAGIGEFELCLRGVGKIEPKESGFNFFFPGANSFKTRVWTRWTSLKEEI